MLSRSQYIFEILDWAEQEGFEWKRAQAGTAFFDTIILKAGDQSALTLIAVSLEGWLDSGMQHYNQMQQTVESVRTAGNQCVVLWQDFWEGKKTLVQSRLMALLHKSETIPGRLTKARRIDQATAASFLEKNHLNGATSAKFKYGLYLPERYFRVVKRTEILPVGKSELLVAVATFSNPRIFRKDEQPHKSYELIRFANLIGTNVIGGLDKLLHAFTAERAPDDIMTYADLDWSVGRSYEKLGFEEKGYLLPEQYYLDIETFERLHSSRVNDVKSNQVIIQNSGSIKFVKNLSRS